MKTILLFFILITILAGCVTAGSISRKESLKECVKEFIKLDVPIQEATKTCKEIYENPHLEYEENQ